MRNASSSMLCYGRDACPPRSCGWLRRCTCSVQHSSIFPIRPPSHPTHPPDFILPHIHPSFFTSSFTHVQTHSTHVLSPFSLILPSALPAKSFTSIDSSDRLHSPPHLLHLLWGRLASLTGPSSSFLAVSPSLPFSEMSSCRREFQPLIRTPLRGVVSTQHAGVECFGARPSSCFGGRMFSEKRGLGRLKRQGGVTMK